MAKVGDVVVVARRGAVEYRSARLVSKDIASGSAGERVVATESAEDIVSAAAEKRVGASIAGEDVVEIRAVEGNNAAEEAVGAFGRVAGRTSGSVCTEKCDNSPSRAEESDAGGEVPGDGVDAATALNLVEVAAGTPGTLITGIDARIGVRKPVKPEAS